MDSSLENDHGDCHPESVETAWHHCKEIFSASSISEAWSSFKEMTETLPAWALVVAVVSLITLIANAWVIPVLVTIGCGMTAVHYTVKHAMRQALRDHDSQQQR